MVNRFKPKLFTLLFVTVCQTAFAADHYVATNGSDSASGASGSPWKTIGHGVSEMASGDTLIVRAGTYAGTANFINTKLHNLPDGSSGNYTVVKAETPMTVRITNNGAGLNYSDELVRLGGKYVEVDGFVFDLKDSQYPPNNGSINGNYNKIRRSIFRREGNVDPYGGWLRVGGSYNLVEDVGGVGAARYGFGSGGTSASGAYNIWRRVVGRFDYSSSNQPKSVFNHYGNNSGYNTHHHIYQNCISINGNSVAWGGGTNGYKRGGFSLIKNASDDQLVGSISIGEETEYGGLFLSGRNHLIKDNIIWGLKKGSNGNIVPDGIWARSSLESMQEATRFTIGDVESGEFVDDNSGRLSLANSLFNPSQKYLLHPDAGPNTAQGATVMKRIGRSGTVYGQSGWNEATNEDLWPWPYEDRIKAVFAEPNNPPSGATPKSNDTKRGFAANTDKFGQPMTLTRYIWQYLGNKIPDNIYGGSTVSGPPAVTEGSPAVAPDVVSVCQIGKDC